MVGVAGTAIAAMGRNGHSEGRNGAIEVKKWQGTCNAHCSRKQISPAVQKVGQAMRRPQQFLPNRPAAVSLQTSVCVCSHRPKMSAAMLTRSAIRTQVFAARTSARASTRGRRSVCVRATVSAMGTSGAAGVSAGHRGLPHEPLSGSAGSQTPS